MVNVHVDEGDDLVLQDACPVKSPAGGCPDALIFVPLPVYPDGHPGRRDPQAVEGLSHSFLNGGTPPDKEDVHKAEKLILRCRGHEVLVLG